MMTAQSGNVISGTIQSDARVPTPLSIIKSLTSTERDIRGCSLFLFFPLHPLKTPAKHLAAVGASKLLLLLHTGAAVLTRATRLSPRCERPSLIAWPIYS